MAEKPLDSEPRRARWPGLLSLWLMLSPMAGPVPAQDSLRGTSAKDSADALMRSALSSALQPQGRQAVAALRALDSTVLSARYVPTRRCMLERLGLRRAESPQVSNSAVAGA